MFLDQSKRPDKKVAGNQDQPDQVGRECGPEAAIDVHDDANDQQEDTQLQAIANQKRVKFHSGTKI